MTLRPSYFFLLPTGAVVIQEILFTLVSEDPVSFTLNCRTTGGPATEVTWFKDNVPVPEDSDHVRDQVVVNGETAEYNNTLTVNGLESGLYRCRVNNDRLDNPIECRPVQVGCMYM